MGPSNSTYLSNTAIFHFHDYGRKSMSQLETQHQVTMLGNDKYTKPVGKFGSLFACRCGQLKRCGVTGQFSPMKFLANCLTPSKKFGKKETFEIVSTNANDPKISAVQTSFLLIIATIGWQGSWWLQWSWCLQGWCFCLGSIANTRKNDFIEIGASTRF